MINAEFVSPEEWSEAPKTLADQVRDFLETTYDGSNYENFCRQIMPRLPDYPSATDTEKRNLNKTFSVLTEGLFDFIGYSNESYPEACIELAYQLVSSHVSTGGDASYIQAAHLTIALCADLPSLQMLSESVAKNSQDPRRGIAQNIYDLIARPGILPTKQELLVPPTDINSSPESFRKYWFSMRFRTGVIPEKLRKKDLLLTPKRLVGDTIKKITPTLKDLENRVLSLIDGLIEQT